MRGNSPDPRLLPALIQRRSDVWRGLVCPEEEKGGLLPDLVKTRDFVHGSLLSRATELD